MNANIPIPFSLGEPVWCVGNEHHEEWITCPDCVGTGIVTLTLGSGESFRIDCGLCRVGYDPPSGVIKRVVYEHRPERFTPRRVLIDGDDISYSSSPPDANCYISVKSTDLFTDEATCLKACEERNAKHQAEEYARFLNIKKNKHRDYASHVSYWRKEIRRLEKELIQHKRLLGIAEEKLAEGGR